MGKKRIKNWTRPSESSNLYQAPLPRNDGEIPDRWPSETDKPNLAPLLGVDYDESDRWSSGFSEKPNRARLQCVDHGLASMEEKKASTNSICSRSSVDFDANTPQASQRDESLEPQSKSNLGYEAGTSECEYLTPVINVYVGHWERCFFVHRGVLARVPSLLSKCERYHESESLRLPEVSPCLFDLLLTYLYKGDYPISKPFRMLKDGLGNDAENAFKTHAQVYCLAAKFKLDPLIETTTKRMNEVDGMEFHSLIDIAKEVYPELVDDDVWFRSYVKSETSKALTENPNVAEEKWILEIHETFGGKLAVDLFTTFVAYYKNRAKVSEKIMQEAVNNHPISSFTPEAAKAWSFAGQCPDRVEHLKKKGNEFQWKHCAWCREDRKRILRDVNELMTGDWTTLVDVKKCLQQGMLLVEKVLATNGVDTVRETIDRLPSTSPDTKIGAVQHPKLTSSGANIKEAQPPRFHHPAVSTSSKLASPIDTAFVGSTSSSVELPTARGDFEQQLKQESTLGVEISKPQPYATDEVGLETSKDHEAVLVDSKGFTPPLEGSSPKENRLDELKATNKVRKHKKRNNGPGRKELSLQVEILILETEELNLKNEMLSLQLKTEKLELERKRDQLREQEEMVRKLKKGITKKSEDKRGTNMKKGKEKESTGKEKVKKVKKVKKDHKVKEAIRNWVEDANLPISQSPYILISEDDLPNESISSSARMQDAHERNGDEIKLIYPSMTSKVAYIREDCGLHMDSVEKQQETGSGRASETSSERGNGKSVKGWMSWDKKYRAGLKEEETFSVEASIDMYLSKQHEKQHSSSGSIQNDERDVESPGSIQNDEWDVESPELEMSEIDEGGYDDD